VLLLDTPVQVLPASRMELLGSPAMAGELRQVHRISDAGESVGDMKHLYRRTAAPAIREAALLPSHSKPLIGDLH